MRAQAKLRRKVRRAWSRGSLRPVTATFSVPWEGWAVTVQASHDGRTGTRVHGVPDRHVSLRGSVKPSIRRSAATQGPETARYEARQWAARSLRERKPTMNPRSIGARCGALCALFLVFVAGWPLASSAQNSHSLPLVLPAGGAQTGFVRIANNADQAGTVRITAIDDTGERFGPVNLSLDGNEAVNLNSRDLEQGNARKGLPVGAGDGSGSWRLVLETALNITPLAYIRTGDGFVTAMHDVAGTTEADTRRYRVMFFNPASNVRQVSRLRLINAGGTAAEVEITGRDDAGRAAPGGTVNVDIPAGGARTLTAQALEAGGRNFGGRLGNGAGKWRLIVSSNVDLQVMNLLATPTGHLANLSTVPGAAVAAGPTGPTDPTVPPEPPAPEGISISGLSLEQADRYSYRLSFRIRSSSGTWPGRMTACLHSRAGDPTTEYLINNRNVLPTCALPNDRLRGWFNTSEDYLNVPTRAGTQLSELVTGVYYPRGSVWNPYTVRVCINGPPVNGEIPPPVTCDTVSITLAR